MTLERLLYSQTVGNEPAALDGVRPKSLMNLSITTALRTSEFRGILLDLVYIYYEKVFLRTTIKFSITSVTLTPQYILYCHNTY